MPYRIHRVTRAWPRRSILGVPIVLPPCARAGCHAHSDVQPASAQRTERFVLCRARNRSPGIGVDRIGETPLSDLTRLLDLLHSAFDTVEPQKLTAVHGVAQVDPSPDAWK